MENNNTDLELSHTSLRFNASILEWLIYGGGYALESVIKTKTRPRHKQNDRTSTHQSRTNRELRKLEKMRCVFQIGSRKVKGRFPSKLYSITEKGLVYYLRSTNNDVSKTRVSRFFKNIRVIADKNDLLLPMTFALFRQVEDKEDFQALSAIFEDLLINGHLLRQWIAANYGNDLLASRAQELMDYILSGKPLSVGSELASSPFDNMVIGLLLSPAYHDTLERFLSIVKRTDKNMRLIGLVFSLIDNQYKTVFEELDILTNSRKLAEKYLLSMREETAIS